MIFSIIVYFILSASSIFLTLIIVPIESKLAWKIKPQPYQLANEYDDVKLNCEFEDTTSNIQSSNSYFVIWYKDGSSQNVLALNDKLASLNSTNYRIEGKYNLVIRNVTKSHSGLYTCQLFQSNDLISTVNLTVFVPAKYAKITTKEESSENPYKLSNKGYFVENDRISLECCTNADVNPEPVFEWNKIERFTSIQTQSIKLNNTIYIKEENLCNSLQINLTRFDNNFKYKCSISNEALGNRTKSVHDTISLTVEYKPEVTLHLASNSNMRNRLKLVENSTISLYCNSTAIPNVQTYQWYFQDIPLRDQQTSTLLLKNLYSHHSGIYSCKATNKHGSSRSSISVEILYAKIKAVNRTLSYLESVNLKQPNTVYLNAIENSSISFLCELESNPLLDKVIWYYFQINNENKIINKVMVSNNLIMGSNRMINDTYKIHTSLLNLHNVTSNHSGYYACTTQAKITDYLNRIAYINLNSTFFLQVQYSPVVKAIRKKVFATNYDQTELSCEIKSNPQSIITWFYGNKELTSNYKYNITNIVYKQINRSNLDDISNFQFFRSSLMINSLSQFDYGDYYCRANNIIGENGQVITIKKKQRPETPKDFKILETTSNSVKISWISGLNGGENSTYLLTINDVFNLTTLSDKDILNEPSEGQIIEIEIRGLQSNQEYSFKLLAFNSMGSSEYSPSVKTKSLPTNFKQEHLPEISNAQFNEIREAICFEIEQIIDRSLRIDRETGLKDYVVKIDLNINDEIFYKESNLRNISTNLPKQSNKTFLFNLNKLRYGQNCISFSQLTELDWLLRNNTTFLQQISGRKKQSNVFAINSALALNYPKIAFSKSQDSVAKIESIGRNFYEFKRLHQVNLSICFSNDSAICSSIIRVKDYTPDFSTYITLIAIGCSTIFIFIVLLLASLCCCCCKRHQTIKSPHKTDFNSKLVIKSFPIVSNQQGSYDFSDSSYKSSQQQIFNGSSVASSHCSGSTTYSRANEKMFYHDEHHLFEANVPTKYVSNPYKIDFNQNFSSVATVESDASSSSSIENKTISTSNGKSSTSHSPYAVSAENQSNSYFSSASSYSAAMNSQESHTLGKPQTLVYNGSNNIYIKTYQHQPQQSQQRNLFTNISNNESLESGYSTPINTTNSTTLNKKLVYEVIV